MSGVVAATIDGWPEVSLADLNERAALLDRAENKYVIPQETLADALTDLAGDFDVLSISRTKQFTYDTVYFDSPHLSCYRDHVQGRRRRMKVRSRYYADSDLAFFEVKLKGLRGRTIKERMTYTRAEHGRVTPEAARFVAGCTAKVYGDAFGEPLDATLRMSYRRITLVGRNSAERVTIDHELRFARNAVEHVAPASTTIVEVKSPAGRGRADEVFRTRGIRGQSCSKYCVGLTLLEDGLTLNPFVRMLRSDFGWDPPPAPPTTTTTLDHLDMDLLNRVVRLAEHLAETDDRPLAEVVAAQLAGIRGAARLKDGA